MKKLILPFLALVSFFSCDKIDDPFQEITTNTVDTTSTEETRVPFKKILIEDFTGHKCGNCPQAAAKIDELKGIYGDTIVAIGVHAGFFAQTSSGPEYTTDFTTPAGDEYNTLFGNDIAGNPNGFVDRNSTLINDSRIIKPESWGIAVEKIAGEAPKVDIQLTANFDAASKTASITVNTEVLENLTGKYNLVVQLIESHIIDWQKDYSKPSGQQDIADYEHNHVLRDNLNGTWGEEIISLNASVGETFENTYSYTLNSSWVPENCDIVAYLFDNTDGNTKYFVINVEEVHLTE